MHCWGRHTYTKNLLFVSLKSSFNRVCYILSGNPVYHHRHTMVCYEKHAKLDPISRVKNKC